MRRYDHFIDGAWVAPATGAYLESIDPATAAPWAKVARGNQDDAETAMASAQAAFRDGPWSRAGVQDRVTMLIALADALETRWEELVDPEVRDNGKRITEVRGQFAALHTWYRHFAAELRKLEPEPHQNAVPGVTSASHFLPYGVVVAITPWNSPLMILAWKLAPALAAGNTVVVKPSELASASTLEFAKLAHEAGLPAGVLNVVTGLGHEVGATLVKHPLTRKITFTGSDQGGRAVAGGAAAGVVPATLELGGKSPQVVFADADLDNAVNGILSGIFLSNGQTCVAGSRLIVHGDIKQDLVARLVERVAGLKAGNPLDPATQVAPLANRAHLDKVLGMIEQAIGEGARCLVGGTRLAPADCPDGYFVAPTIFDNVSPEMEVWREEVFGPVLAVAPFEVEEEAIRLANDSKYGLAAGVWTADPTRGARIANQIESGTVYINHYRSVDPDAPIGGVKLSGYGRELGPDAIKDFLQVKSIWSGEAPMPDPFP
ncbi:MAG: aldehyde dehydrogenase [Pseudomonadota bacterium]